MKRDVLADRVYVTHTIWPGVCAVMLEDTVATVLTKEISKVIGEQMQDHKQKQLRKTTRKRSR